MLWKRKPKKKEIWPVRCGGNPILYVDLENCDQVGLAREILKTAYGWSQERIDKIGK